ncbi:hypothetical protein [Haliscomenobacter sp.]|uniref:hypothetical protein n=1 Tax=Haliscomenobacter sp. TaxID=2717303 RepID=UPI003593526B
MKTIAAILFMILIAFGGLSAQQSNFYPTQRGNFMIGSSMGFSISKSSIDVQSNTGSVQGDGGRASQFNLSPSIGYFLGQNFVMGIGMDWLRTTSTAGVDLGDATVPPVRSENDNLLFGPFVRYYIPSGENKAYFLDATIGFGNSRNQFIENKETQIIDNSLLSIGVGPGFTIFASDGIALEALVKYNFAKSDSQINVGEISRTSVTWTNALDFSVGIRYYFGGVRPAAAQQQPIPLNSGSLYR